MSEMKIGFELKTIQVPLDKIMPVKFFTANRKKEITLFHRARIRADIQRLGCRVAIDDFGARCPRHKFQRAFFHK